MHPEVSEIKLKIDDLINADELILTNVLRGEMKVSKLFVSPTEYISYEK